MAPRCRPPSAQSADTLVAGVMGLHNRIEMNRSRSGGSHDGSTPIAFGRLHAPGRHPHRLVALSRRLPRRQFQLAAPDPFCADPGARPVRRLLHGRPSGRAQHADGGAEAQRHGHLVRSADPAAGAGDGDRASRADRHRLDDLRAALPDRPALRLARPHQRRPRRLEPGHHLQPRRGAQFRADRAHGAWRALSPRPRVLRCRDRPVGQLGRRRLHPRRRERHLFRSRAAARARPQGRIPVGARPARTSPGRSRAGRSSSRPAPPTPAASSPPKPPR